MPSALQNALAFQGIGQGVQNLVGILLQKQQMAEQRAQEEQSAQALMSLLPLLLQDQGGGAPAVPEGTIGPPPPPPETPTLSPEVQAMLTGITKRASGVKTRDEAMALLGLAQGVRGERRAAAEEERKFQREKELIGLQGKQRIDLEKERQAVDLAEKRLKREGLASQAKGGLKALTGVPTLLPEIERMIEGDPEQAAAYVETMLGLRPRAGTAEGFTPQDEEAVLTLLNAGAGTLERGGLSLTPEQRGKVAKSKTAATAPLSLLGSSSLAMEPGRRTRQLEDMGMKIQLKIADLIGKAEDEKTKARYQRLGAIIQNRFTSEDMFGNRIPADRDELGTALREASGFLSGIKGEGESEAMKFLKGLSTQIGGAKEQAKAEETRIPVLPPTLKTKYGISQGLWEQLFHKGMGEAGDFQITVNNILRGLSASGVNISAEDEFAIWNEVYGLASRPSR